MRAFTSSLVLVCIVVALASAAAPVPRQTLEQKLLERVKVAVWRKALSAWKAGRAEEAEKTVRKILALEIRDNGVNHFSVAKTLGVLAIIRQKQKAHEEAADILDRKATVLARLFGAEDHRCGTARLEASEARLESRLTPRQRQVRARADSLEQDAIRLRTQGKYQRALPIAREVLQLRTDALGARHITRATALSNLAGILHISGQHAEALPLFHEALVISRETLGAKHPYHGGLLNNLAALYRDMGKPLDALPLQQQALRITREVHGDRHTAYAGVANNLAALYLTLGEPRLALPLLQQAVAIRREALGENHPAHATSLDNLAGLYNQMGEHDRALALYQQVLKIRQEAQGEKHPDYATSLGNLGKLLQDMGRHDQALPLFRQSLAINQEALGEKHPAYLKSLNHLATQLEDMGDLRQALPLYQRTLELRREVLGEKHPDYATSLSNLAALYLKLNEPRLALPLLRQSRTIRRDVLGAKHPHHASSLNSLAVIHQALGQYRQSLDLFQQVLKINREVLGEKHPSYATSLNNLAMLYQAMGESRQALPLYQQVVAIQKEVLREGHPDRARCLSNLAALYHALDRPWNAIPLRGQGVAMTRAYLERVASWQGERQQLDAERMLRFQLDLLLSHSKSLPMPASVVHDQVLSMKGSVQTRQVLHRLLRDVQSEDVRTMLLALQDANRDLARLALDSVEAREVENHRRKLTLLTQQKEALESSLARRAGFQQPTPARSRHLAASLPEGVALVDFLVYGDFGKEVRLVRTHPPKKLVAFVVTRGAPTMRVDLGPVEPIDRAVSAWRQNLDRSAASGDDPAQVLRRLVWLPIEKHLSGERTVILSPDGALAGLPFAALPGRKDGTYLLEQYALAVAPVPGLVLELLKRREEKGDPSLLLVGDVAFDRGKRRVAREDARGTLRGSLGDWHPLPGTAEEVTQIASLFRTRYREKSPVLLQGDRATKAAVRSALGKHRWVHLATHGFFAPPEVKSALDGVPREDAFQSGRREVSGWHPLLLSGIVLAGANHKSAPGEEDGILTALEVSGMDLRHCDLAVLSACETGLGKVAGGQGVLGLQRAFAVAGVGTTVTSLWSVNDAATSVLMERFYRTLLGSEKVSNLEALHQAQLYVLKNPETVRQRVRHLHAVLKKQGVEESVLTARGIGTRPVKVAVTGGAERSPITWWAAFVLAGDWR